MKKCFLLLTLCASLLTGCHPTPNGPEGFASSSPAKIYNDGIAAMYDGYHQTALKHFEALDALYPFSSYTERALLQSVYAYYEQDDMESAVAAADRYIHLYPRSTNVDYAYYMKGVVNMRRNRSWAYRYFNISAYKRDLSGLRDAFSDFRALVTLFPHSRYAADAQKRMIFIRSELAKAELHVAKFYFKRNAYVAAANRASYIVEHYQGSKEVEPALHMMVDSYERLGKQDLANDARKVLQANYPV